MEPECGKMKINITKKTSKGHSSKQYLNWPHPLSSISISLGLNLFALKAFILLMSEASVVIEYSKMALFMSSNVPWFLFLEYHLLSTLLLWDRLLHRANIVQMSWKYGRLKKFLKASYFSWQPCRQEQTHAQFSGRSYGAFGYMTQDPIKPLPHFTMVRSSLPKIVVFSSHMCNTFLQECQISFLV